MNNTKVSRIVFRLHGSFLIILTTLLIVLSSVGTFLGIGAFAWLHVDPITETGFFQAYSLMMTIATVLSGVGIPFIVPPHGFFILLQLFILSRY